MALISLTTFAGLRSASAGRLSPFGVTTDNSAEVTALFQEVEPVPIPIALFMLTLIAEVPLGLAE